MSKETNRYNLGAMAQQISDIKEDINEIKLSLRDLKKSLKDEFVTKDNHENLSNRVNKIEQIVTLLKGALLAEQKVVLKMNVSTENLPKVLELLPALRKPTISGLHEESWVAVETVIDEKKVRELVYKLKEAGAEGIIEYSLNKIIP